MNETNFSKKALQATDFWISGLIFLAILALLLFASIKVYKIFADFAQTTTITIVHDVALFVVLVKAYRVLHSYFKKHHISIKYILEISIIAPAIEIIFAYSKQPLPVNILFAFFSLASLVIYLLFYEKLSVIENKELKPVSQIQTNDNN